MHGPVGAARLAVLAGAVERVDDPHPVARRSGAGPPGPPRTARRRRVGPRASASAMRRWAAASPASITSQADRRPTVGQVHEHHRLGASAARPRLRRPAGSAERGGLPRRHEARCSSAGVPGPEPEPDPEPLDPSDAAEGGDTGLDHRGSRRLGRRAVVLVPRRRRDVRRPSRSTTSSLLNWIVGPLWLVLVVVGRGRDPVRIVVPLGAGGGDGDELGGPPVRDLRRAGPPPEEDARQGAASWASSSATSRLTSCPSSGCTGSRSAATTTASTVPQKWHRGWPGMGLTHTLFLGARVHARVLAVEAQPGVHASGTSSATPPMRSPTSTTRSARCCCSRSTTLNWTCRRGPTRRRSRAASTSTRRRTTRASVW